MRLQDASARVSEVEAAAEKASRELAEYKAESSELRNQDLTIRRLEERVRGLEADLQEKVHRPALWRAAPHSSSMLRCPPAPLVMGCWRPHSHVHTDVPS